MLSKSVVHDVAARCKVLTPRLERKPQQRQKPAEEPEDAEVAEAAEARAEELAQQLAAKDQPFWKRRHR